MAIWQLQEAKQRFSEVVHRTQTDGPQVVTRHGLPVVVMVDISEYRHLTKQDQDFRDFLLSFPALDHSAAGVFDEVATERARQLPRDVELGV